MNLKHAHRYRATIQIGWMQRAFASEGVIADRLRGVGFVAVDVISLGGGTYRAFATWPGADADVEDMPREVSDVVDLGGVS